MAAALRGRGAKVGVENGGTREDGHGRAAVLKSPGVRTGTCGCFDVINRRRENEMLSPGGRGPSQALSCCCLCGVLVSSLTRPRPFHEMQAFAHLSSVVVLNPHLKICSLI